MNSIRTSRAIAVGCLSAATLLGVSATAAADPTSDDKLAVLIPAGSADCQVSQPYSEDPSSPDLAAARTVNRAARTAPSTRCTEAPPTWIRPSADWLAAVVPSHALERPAWWTKTADSFVGSATGSDLTALYTWWLGAR
ncbi:hypothetical protein ACIA48_27480 [Mycobacterium sp. NPDC051804]|uniref:hypothetical protein n=1 Tax=Mycobacterium sp. NPDC051804 TaxID=3364295 RepID=UPI0037BE1F8F